MNQLESAPVFSERYQPVCEIGRGGMGTVWKVIDRQFERPLAVKLMLPVGTGQTEAQQRFEREAVITASLQHPAIPPVVDRGVLADGSPYFSLKLIEGQTLSTLLKQRSSTAEHLPRFLGVFEQVCQAVGYAHSQGILHRDLKPANVMVGEFNEVQVMDWGMAKWISQQTFGPRESHSQALDDPLDNFDPDAQTIDFRTDPEASGDTDAAGESCTLTCNGQVLGTLAYMPPEQARGDQLLLDARTDVFALGGILCSILTGQPPHRGSDAADVFRKVRAGQLDEAMARVAACGADDDIIRLCQNCLHADPQLRPADGAEVAASIRRYEEQTRARLEQQKSERIAAEARAAEEKKRRRVTLVAAALSVLLVALLAIGAWSIQSEKAKRETRELQAQLAQTARENQARSDVESALTLVPELRGQYQFAAAAALLTQAESRVESLASLPELPQRLQRERLDLQAARELDRIRLDMSRSSNAAFDRQFALGEQGAYAAVFAAHELDILNGETESLADVIRESAIRDELIDGLDAWATYETEPLAARIRQVAIAADSDSVRNRIRDAAMWQDPAARENLLEELDARRLSPTFVTGISDRLRAIGETQRAVDLLESTLQHHPDDFWAHFYLALFMGDLNAPLESQIGHYRTALALRPDATSVHNNLAILLEAQGKLEQAEQLCRVAIELTAPQTPPYLINQLGLALKAQLRNPEAEAVFREALQQDANYGDAHCNLGNVLTNMKRFEEAEQHIQSAIRIDPDRIAYRINLAACFKDQQRLAEAEETYRAALKLDPQSAVTYTKLGVLFKETGRLEEALDILQQGLEIEPRSAEAWWNLGVVLESQQQFAPAEQAYRKALEHDPRFRETPNSMGILLTKLQRFAEAERTLLSAIPLDPDWHLPHFNLAWAYYQQQKLEAAEKAFRESARLAPNHLPSLGMLSMTLKAQEKYAAAAEIARQGFALSPPESSDAAQFQGLVNELERLLQGESTDDSPPAEPTDPPESP